jgi:hypothetical protein
LLFLFLVDVNGGEASIEFQILLPCLVCGISIRLGNEIVITENKREWNGMAIPTL